MITPGIRELPQIIELMKAIEQFDTFNEDNDPYGEHDFGKVVVNGTACFWKISYYDNRMEYGSEDPANPDITTRVLTIMLTSEYLRLILDR